VDWERWLEQRLGAPLLTVSLCVDPEPEWRPYAVREPSAASSKSEAIGMADVMFLAIGGGAFVAFAALAVFLKRV
jgi:hypothetical protein